MTRWYTTYVGYDWTPAKGYSDLFVSYVRAIREQFHLQKTSTPGIEISNGVWKPYAVQGENVQVIVDQFEWKRMTDDDDVCFVLKMRVAKQAKWWQKLFMNPSATRTKVIFDETVTVLFRSDFPNSPPLFQIMNAGYRNLRDLHEHHIYSQGIMCILADSSDWNPNRDTILRALNAAIDWIVWHEKTWGSDPRRWR